jgi:hypothetical protein
MTTGTSPAATTLTPENSEQPRETRDGMPLVERFDAARAAWQDESTELKPEHVDYLLKDNPLYQRAKVSSPELASLAAKYVDISASDWPEQSKDVAKFLHDVRSLAASVLAQAEPSK